MVVGVAPLKQNELFESLTDEELIRLAPLCNYYVAIEDSMLFVEGKTARRLYLVLDGQIALQKSIRVPHARYSRRTTVTICGPGEVAGWSALVRPYVYTLSALAWRSSRLISMDAKLLRRAITSYPDIGYKVMESLAAVMSRRLKQTTDILINERELILAGLKV